MALTRDEVKAISAHVAAHLRARVVSQAHCQGQTHRILEAIDGVRKQTDKIPVIEQRLARHEGEHSGREMAAHARAGGASAVVKWIGLGATLLGMAVAAGLWIGQRFGG